MMKRKPQSQKPGLSLSAALKYFLTGNMVFAFNGIVVSTIDAISNIFPPLF